MPFGGLGQGDTGQGRGYVSDRMTAERRRPVLRWPFFDPDLPGGANRPLLDQLDAPPPMRLIRVAWAGLAHLFAWSAGLR
jgi:hypothetical protein